MYSWEGGTLKGKDTHTHINLTFGKVYKNKWPCDYITRAPPSTLQKGGAWSHEPGWLHVNPLVHSHCVCAGGEKQVLTDLKAKSDIGTSAF